MLYKTSFNAVLLRQRYVTRDSVYRNMQNSSNNIGTTNVALKVALVAMKSSRGTSPTDELDIASERFCKFLRCFVLATVSSILYHLPEHSDKIKYPKRSLNNSVFLIKATVNYVYR